MLTRGAVSVFDAYPLEHVSLTAIHAIATAPFRLYLGFTACLVVSVRQLFHGLVT